MNSQQTRTRRQRHCRECGCTDHDRRNCPVLRASRERNEIQNTPSSEPQTQTSQYIWTGGGLSGMSGLIHLVQRNLETNQNAETNQQDSDEQMARRLQMQEMNQDTRMSITNNTRSCIYVYKFNHQTGYWNLGNRYIDAGCTGNLILHTMQSSIDIKPIFVLNHDYGPSVIMEDINKDHILKMFDNDMSFTNLPKNENGVIMLDIGTQESSQADLWKEAALKTSYIIHQLNRLGANKNPNYELILDMFQDIQFPEHTEQDKERSGISSSWTNIQVTTGIDEPTAEESERLIREQQMRRQGH
jgi:hypothetical protein